MQGSLAGLLSALIACALAKNVAPLNLPVNAQDGIVNFPLKCKSNFLNNPTFDAIFTATLPVVGGLGQDIYFTETTATIIVPPSAIINEGHKVGITQASALVHVDLDATNATPGSTPVFPNGLLIQNISIPYKKDIVVPVPGGSGVIPPIGPIKLGNTKGDAVFTLGTLNILLNLQDAQGQTQIDNITVICPVQHPKTILALVSVAKPAGEPPLKLFSGGKGNFPNVSTNQELGSFRFPYSCDFAQYGKHILDLSVTGEVKTVLQPNEKFYLNNATAFLRVSKKVVTEFKAKTPGIAKLRSTFKSFYITTTNAAPAQINALSSPITSTSSVGNEEISIPIPEEGFLHVGPITAGSTIGQVTNLGIGTATATLELLNDSGKVLSTVATQCHSIYPIDLIGLYIVNGTSTK